MKSSLLLSTSQISDWRTKGFCVVDNFDVSEVRTRCIFDGKGDLEDFGSNSGYFAFPTGDMALDYLPIRLHQAVCELLQDPLSFLSQGDFWIKKRRQGPRTELSNDDQRMHCDFGNNILLNPSWDRPSAVSVIVYLDSSGDDCQGGATQAVPRLGSSDEAYRRDSHIIQPGYGGRPFINNKDDAEKWFQLHRPEEYLFRQRLYDRAVNVFPKRGRVLFYRLDLWHRGTPLLSGTRRVMNMVWFSQEAIATGGRWNPGFWKTSYDINARGVYAAPDKLFVVLTPEERVAIGLPPKESPFWNRENLRLIKLRFPEFDETPYMEIWKTKKSKI